MYLRRKISVCKNLRRRTHRSCQDCNGLRLEFLFTVWYVRISLVNSGVSDRSGRLNQKPSKEIKLFSQFVVCVLRENFECEGETERRNECNCTFHFIFKQSRIAWSGFSFFEYTRLMLLLHLVCFWRIECMLVLCNMGGIYVCVYLSLEYECTW